ncbi:hypothetical protein B7760_06061 (plasmid) [Burkholderia glumae]|nr:hypothetical protein B7760_06061 [Burkholderia glumae]
MSAPGSVPGGENYVGMGGSMLYAIVERAGVPILIVATGTIFNLFHFKPMSPPRAPRARKSRNVSEECRDVAIRVGPAAGLRVAVAEPDGIHHGVAAFINAVWIADHLEFCKDVFAPHVQIDVTE